MPEDLEEATFRADQAEKEVAEMSDHIGYLDRRQHATWQERDFYRSALVEIVEKCGDSSDPEHNAVAMARTALAWNQTDSRQENA